MVSKLVKSELDMSGRRGDREKGRCSSDDISRPIAPSPTRPINSMTGKIDNHRFVGSLFGSGYAGLGLGAFIYVPEGLLIIAQ